MKFPWMGGMQKNDLDIKWLPLFKKGVFKDNPSLFAPYFRNTPEYLKRRYQAAQDRLPEFENTIQWPMIRGCGIYGATHPGAGKSFNNIMIGGKHPVYNSDCLYVNSTRNVFAISDSPGATTFSRRFFEKLDRHLERNPENDIGGLIYRLNHSIARHERATLALLSFDHSRPGERVQAFVAGDTLVFHCNFHRKTMTPVTGLYEFIGRLSARPKIIEIELEKEDFFVIASDGITSIRKNGQSEVIESLLRDYLDGNMDLFVPDVMAQCNRIFVEKTANGDQTKFCGNDDCTVLLVIPQQLEQKGSCRSCILGGYVQQP